ncbi:MAG TPA: twin-arginine translocase TatA/TatE family subunit [Thermoanaerobaculia bacterium]
MFGSLGFPEILLILVLALLIFGPKRLPEVGRTIGKGLSEFRRASSDLKRTVNAELALEEDERPATTRRPDLGGPAGTAAARTAALRELPTPPSAPGGPPEATAPRAPVEPEKADTEPPIDAPAEEAAGAAADEPATTH